MLRLLSSRPLLVVGVLVLAQAAGAAAADDPANCTFESIEDFFDYTASNKLNVTAEVVRCQSLCPLIYGNGNADLSGIGMMVSYTFQVALAFIFGPIFRLLYSSTHLYKQRSKLRLRDLVLASRELQMVFWESNGFLVLASAVATLVRMNQHPTIFEISEMQVLAFMQLMTLFVTYFCLAHPVPRFWQRFAQFLTGFVLATVALSQARLSGNSTEADWDAAARGCQSAHSVFKALTPIPFRRRAVYAVAGVAGVAFLVQSIAVRYVRLWRGKRVWERVMLALKVMRAVTVAAALAAMIMSLVSLWRQRDELRDVIGDDFSDNEWGFGQVAALFTWLPIPIEISYRVNDWLMDRSEWWARIQNKLAPQDDHRDHVGTAPATTAFEPHHEHHVYETDREPKDRSEYHSMALPGPGTP